MRRITQDSIANRVESLTVQIHERVSTQAMLRVLARDEVQRSLFADPALECHQAVRFYLHDA